MDVYEIAGMDAARREAVLNGALERYESARADLAQAKVGQAVALLRELAPGAAEIRFRVEDSDRGGKYAVVHRIGGRQADSVLFDLDGDDDSEVDSDALTPVEDYLAGAAEAGARFEKGLFDEYVLRLVR